jgi:hypothetical protein
MYIVSLGERHCSWNGRCAYLGKQIISLVKIDSQRLAEMGSSFRAAAKTFIRYMYLTRLYLALVHAILAQLTHTQYA